MRKQVSLGFGGTRYPLRDVALQDQAKVVFKIKEVVWDIVKEFHNPSLLMNCHVGDCIGTDRVVFEQLTYLKKIGFKLKIIFHRIETPISLSFLPDRSRYDYDDECIYGGETPIVMLRNRTKGMVGSSDHVVLFVRPRPTELGGINIGRGCQLAMNSCRQLKISHDIYFLEEVKTGPFGEVLGGRLRRTY